MMYIIVMTFYDTKVNGKYNYAKKQLVTGNSASNVFDVRAASSQLVVPFRTVSGLHLGRTPESKSRGVEQKSSALRLYDGRPCYC